MARSRSGQIAACLFGVLLVLGGCGGEGGNAALGEAALRARLQDVAVESRLCDDADERLNHQRVDGRCLRSAVALAGTGAGRRVLQERRTLAVPVAAATPSVDTATFFTWAERSYPALFPAGASTQGADPFAYRYYPATRQYLILAAGKIYLFNGGGGGDIAFVANLADIAHIVAAPQGCSTAPTPPPATPLPLMIDSLGQPVPEEVFGGGDSGAAGADGSAGDGAPIANARVTLEDNRGQRATTMTDDQGYYRLGIKCLTPPFVVSVDRPDGTRWYAASTDAVRTRAFVTINLTGLTDKTSEYVAEAAGIAGGAAALTPAQVATNASQLPAAKARLATALESPLTYQGLVPATFDPVKRPYRTVSTDSYDRVLDRLAMGKNAGKTVVVGTFAGVKEPFVDGTGPAASFNSLHGVAVDRSGNVFVADTNNHGIRKVTPAGVVTTIAGTGLEGFKNGTGNAASFRRPEGIAVDAAGNLFVADTGNHVIRKITPAGLVSTFAGSGTAGFANGSGTAATFNVPISLTIDGSGNLYVADYQNYAIRKITPAGLVSTLAGDGTSGFVNGTGTAARFSYPNGVAVDAGGNVFVTDPSNRAIRKITAGGVVTTVTTAVRYPGGIAVDAGGVLYVSDYLVLDPPYIRKVLPNGTVTTLAGNGTTGSVDGPGLQASFKWPDGLAVDTAGNVYVADNGNHSIRKITPAGIVSTLAGSAPQNLSNGSGSQARFYFPKAVAADAAGNVYVADEGNHAVRKVTPQGVVSTIAGDGVSGFVNGTGSSARFKNPSGIAVDSAGNVYVGDSGNYAIRKITPAGVVSTLAGGTIGYQDGIGTAARFSFTVEWAGLAVDSAGNVYVADSGNNVIRKVTPAGVVSTLAGGYVGFDFLVDGVGAGARFQRPAALAIDSSGNLYVADAFNHAVRKVTPAGVVTTLAGNGSSGFSNGTGAAASFKFPIGVAVDKAGNVYVADSSNHAMRKVTPTGQVSTVAGGVLGGGYVNGTTTVASFNSPSGVLVSSQGNLLVADTQNHAVRLVLP